MHTTRSSHNCKLGEAGYLGNRQNWTETAGGDARETEKEGKLL